MTIIKLLSVMFLLFIFIVDKEASKPGDYCGWRNSEYNAVKATIELLYDHGIFSISLMASFCLYKNITIQV